MYINIFSSRTKRSLIFLLLPRFFQTPLTDSLLLSDTALEGEDFIARPQGDPNSVIPLPAGQATATCRIEIVDDCIREADETFTVTLESLALGTLGTTVTTTVTIDDDDDGTCHTHGVCHESRNTSHLNKNLP